MIKISQNIFIIRRHPLVIIFFILLTSFPSFGQSGNREIDSLQNLVNSAKDSIKADLYSELCFRYSFTDPAKALINGQKALTISRALNDGKRMAQAYNDMGMVYHKQGKYDTALVYYNSSKELREKLNLKKPLAAILSKIGIIQYERGDYQVSLANQLRALKIFEQLGDSASIAYSCNNIGNLLNVQKQYDKAGNYFGKALRIGKSSKDNYIQAVAYSGLGTNEYGKLDVPSSIGYYLKALPLMEVSGDKFNISRTYENLGTCYNSLGNRKYALEYFKKALKIDEEIGDEHGFAKHSQTIADYLMEEKKYALAKPYLDRALSESEKLKSKPLLSVTYKSFATYYGGMADYKNQAHYLELYSAVNEEILNGESMHSLTEMQTKYETDKKEKEIRLLNQQKVIQSLAIAKVRAQQVLLGLTLIATIIIAASGYYVVRLREKQKLAKAHLEEQSLRLKAIIETQETERKRIAGELHDGVGQMLCVAKMNASVLREEPYRDPELWENLENILDQSVAEVRNVSHSMMPSVLMKVGLKEAVKEYTEQVNAAKQVRISLNTGMEKRMESLTEVSVYRVIQELIGNALKHGKADKVEIDMQQADGRLYVSVKDNGRGFDQAGLTTNSGNGWFNIRSRLALLQGTAHISSELKKGTEVKFDLPIA